jgi:hypothetical protein
MRTSIVPRNAWAFNWNRNLADNSSRRATEELARYADRRPPQRDGGALLASQGDQGRRRRHPAGPPGVLGLPKASPKRRSPGVSLPGGRFLLPDRVVAGSEKPLTGDRDWDILMWRVMRDIVSYYETGPSKWLSPPIKAGRSLLPFSRGRLASLRSTDTTA